MTSKEALTGPGAGASAAKAVVAEAAAIKTAQAIFLISIASGGVLPETTFGMRKGNGKECVNGFVSPPSFTGLRREWEEVDGVVSSQTTPPAMEMRKIACAILVAATSATMALAANAPAPGPVGASFDVTTSIGAVIGASILSFFAFYLQ
ncbi:putative Arabinogalactan protein 23 [Cocos nucifera]|nr:putative Arabinogalactan protein 23 [Cocos nucifera]